MHTISDRSVIACRGQLVYPSEDSAYTKVSYKCSPVACNYGCEMFNVSVKSLEHDIMGSFTFTAGPQVIGSTLPNTWVSCCRQVNQCTASSANQGSGTSCYWIGDQVSVDLCIYMTIPVLYSRAALELMPLMQCHSPQHKVTAKLLSPVMLWAGNAGLARSCYFLDKVYNAQKAGADAVLVVNDHPGDLSTAVAPKDEDSTRYC